ncbi:hypothetical protein JCM1840_003601 [Sporobolomyces johnsonii]
MPGVPLFLVGSGFIGGSILTALIQGGKHEIAVLCRDEKKAETLKGLGVRPVMGTLDSEDVIAKETANSDVIIHAATADDQPSVKAILKGLAQRSSSKPPAIYIHTSGTGILTVPDHPPSIIFSDKNPKQFDELVPDEAPHRDVDLLIKDAVEKKALNAKITIILPPLIYGRGSGPFNKISIQIPGWIKESIREKRVINHGPEKFWNNISIKNLVPGYLTLLAHMEKTQEPPLYVFCETGYHQWGPAGEHLDKLLKARGLVSQDLTVDPNPSMETACGTMSRSKAELLREWGWEAHDTQTLEESMEEDLDFMLAEKMI